MDKNPWRLPFTLEDEISFWEGLFSGAILVSKRVDMDQI